MSVPSPNPDALRAYLAENDAACPTCGYNLRGLKDGACPECGAVVPAWVCPESQDVLDRRRTVEYLRDHDLICRGCKTNLRGSPDGVCPGCGRTYLARGYPPTGPGRISPWNPRPLLGCILITVLLCAILIAVAQISLWASP